MNNVPIAIVGIGAHFPGGPDLDSFWRLIRDGGSCAREVPRGRWPVDPEGVAGPSEPREDSVRTLQGCFLTGVTTPADCGHVDRSLLEQLDPLFSLTLSVGMEAARSRRNHLRPERTGVIVSSYYGRRYEVHVDEGSRKFRRQNADEKAEKGNQRQGSAANNVD